ncbi:hypothetical protein HAX54_035336 [Datura stramonium]|uniref:Uncharacterized protein n=1 Tax=Datura stramonium TaxID=4076 RepID=A0ABS8VGD5_DATST|nr:hypothetical protein [Datura stramonium]
MHDRFPMVWKTLLFHGWKVFTELLLKYNEALVCDFYAPYAAAMPKKKKGLKQGLLEVVKVRGVDVPCGLKDTATEPTSAPTASQQPIGSKATRPSTCTDAPHTVADTAPRPSSVLTQVSIIKMGQIARTVEAKVDRLE